MSERPRPIVSLDTLELVSFDDGELFKGADASVSAPLGLSQLGLRYNEIPPGKSGCPFHNHHVEEEVFLVLEGEGIYRFGADRHAFKAGDVLGAPAGGHETAHQIINTGNVALRYVGISTLATTEVCEYPDSGKFLVSSRAGGTGERLRHIGRPGVHHLDYYDGEPGA